VSLLTDHLSKTAALYNLDIVLVSYNSIAQCSIDSDACGGVSVDFQTSCVSPITTETSLLGPNLYYSISVAIFTCAEGSAPTISQKHFQPNMLEQPRLELGLIRVMTN
jgi:hypothetical protein